MSLKFIVDAMESNFQLNGAAESLLSTVKFQAKTYKKGESLHRTGDKRSSIYCVETGWLTSVADLANGKRQLLNFHVPIDIVGGELLSNRYASSSLVAFEESRCYLIPIRAFSLALQASPSASYAMLKTLGRKYHALQGRVCIFAHGDAYEKVAYLLLGLRSKQIRNMFDDPETLRLPLTQTDIADALGMTNVTVSRVFSQFAEDGLVTFDRNKIIITDADRLIERISYFESDFYETDEFG